MRSAIPFILLTLAQTFTAQGQRDDLDHFFDQADILLNEYVVKGRVDYERLSDDPRLEELVVFIADYDVSTADENTRKAYLINVYNLLVIQGVVDHYPLHSLLKVFGFFDQPKWIVGSETLSLNKLEKDLILPDFSDPRLHFVLACGALGCPPLADFAYRPEQLDRQLDERTWLALNDDQFLRRTTEDRLELSQIFSWYADDFGGKKSTMLDFVNQYQDDPIESDISISFYSYDWTLNDQQEPLGSPNASRYIVSATVAKGGYELKWFNNLYTQLTPGDGPMDRRESYFTSLVNFVYGFSDRINLGFDLRYRRYSSHIAPASPLKVFTFSDATFSRSVLATFGPKVRFSPMKYWSNFSVQSAVWFPLRDDLDGRGGLPWIDWAGPTWWTQFFNDFDVGTRFSLFTELDFLWEDIGQLQHGRINRISTPVTGIFSYFPNSKTTLYTMVNFSPYWSPDLDYFFQPGLGTKYQFSPRLELEILYTFFTNSFLQEIGGRASTFNLGVRISR